MVLALGVDTGGTYTDAVLIRDESEVVAKAKALTTRPDLSVGIAAAVSRVLEGVDPAEVTMAALSTTLATNALVEGQGDRVALIAAGFGASDLEKHGVSEALKGDPVLMLQGAMAHSGDVAKPLDMARLETFLSDAPDVGAYAVAGLFAVRNPAHEQAIAARVGAVTGKPVSASHQLSARLNGPKRALTAVLNARLVGLIDRLIAQAEARLAKLGITAPLMVVRGDGALIGAAEARRAPIETILSGPAASIVGARWLTGIDTALVSDIGGTTTDVAMLRGGRPAIDPMGARVGPFRTMVEAVAMRTQGLGGDSDVHLNREGLAGGVHLGPRRVIPISLIAQAAPEVVHGTLDTMLRAATVGEFDGRFVRAVPGIGIGGLADREAALLARIGDSVRPLGAVIAKRMELGSLARLVTRGLIQISGVTPSDAAHVLGRLTSWDGAAAEKALALMARRRIGSGEVLAPNAQALAQMIVDQMTRQTCDVLLETALSEDGLMPDLARHPLLQKALAAHRGALRLDARLDLSVVALGASAASYYPAVGAALGCDVVLDPHAGVANAIGAVVGRVRVRRSGQVTAKGEGCFRAHLESGPEDFPEPEAAMARLETVLRDAAQTAAAASGAQSVDVVASREVQMAEIEGRKVFVSAEVSVEASGRPRIAA